MTSLTMNTITLLPLFIAVPLAAALLIALLQRWIKHVAPVLATVAAAFLSFASLYMVQSVPQATVLRLSTKVLTNASIFLVGDALSGLMLVIINIIALSVTVYSWSYLKHYTDQWKYYTLLLLMAAGLNGVVVSGDIFTLYVFLEIASIASYVLVAFGCEQEELEASFKYLILGTLGSTFVLLGIGMLYGLTSSLSFAAIAGTFAGHAGWLPKLIVVFFIMGFSLKAAMVPFHAWLPDAHTSAPAPISAMLSGIVIKTLGIYAITRLLFHVIGFTPEVSRILLILASLSIVAGVFLALYQWDFKRLLAYSSISQVGYIMLGIGLGTPLGIMGGIFHLINHAVFKPLLFMNAGAVEYATGTRRLDRMGGLRKQMPVTAHTSLIASMSISGIPPFSGFWSKLIIIIACIQADKLFLAVIAAGASIVTLAYFLKVQKYAFWGRVNKMWQHIGEVPLPMAGAMLFLSALCLASALLMLPVFNNAFLQPVVQTLLLGLKYGRTLTDTIPYMVP